MPPAPVTRPFAWIGLLVGITITASAAAHEKHHKPVSPPARPLGSDSDTVVAPPGALPAGTAVAESAKAEPPYELPPIGEGVLHHLHNKLVHFPIVLAPITFLTLLLARRRVGLAGLAPALAWLAALSAGAALWAGLNQAPDFGGEPKEWLVQVHRNWGIALTASLTLTALLASWPRFRRHAWIPALLASVLVGIVGYLGGLISHG